MGLNEKQGRREVVEDEDAEVEGCECFTVTLALTLGEMGRC